VAALAALVAFAAGFGAGYWISPACWRAGSGGGQPAPAQAVYVAPILEPCLPPTALPGLEESRVGPVLLRYTSSGSATYVAAWLDAGNGTSLRGLTIRFEGGLEVIALGAGNYSGTRFLNDAFDVGLKPIRVDVVLGNGTRLNATLTPRTRRLSPAVALYCRAGPVIRRGDGFEAHVTLYNDAGRDLEIAGASAWPGEALHDSVLRGGGTAEVVVSAPGGAEGLANGVIVLLTDGRAYYVTSAYLRVRGP